VFFNRSSGYLVVRDVHNGSNVYWSEIESETIYEYQCARETLEGQGFSFKAVVIDGRPGVRKLFADLPADVSLSSESYYHTLPHAATEAGSGQGTARDCTCSVQYE
jgi:hypothetical protein